MQAITTMVGPPANLLPMANLPGGVLSLVLRMPAPYHAAGKRGIGPIWQYRLDAHEAADSWIFHHE
jgi:hypothetical protein